jgi:hypothetical protein
MNWAMPLRAGRRHRVDIETAFLPDQPGKKRAAADRVSPAEAAIRSQIAATS